MPPSIHAKPKHQNGSTEGLHLCQILGACCTKKYHCNNYENSYWSAPNLCEIAFPVKINWNIWLVNDRSYYYIRPVWAFVISSALV